MNPRTRAILAACSCALAVAAAACSSANTSGGAAEPTDPATAAVTTSVPPPAAAADNVLEIDAIDGGPTMSFDITGAPHAGLVTITFGNVGQYAHEVSFAQLKDGVTLEEVKRALGQNEQAAQQLLVDPEGELTGPAILGPGGRERVAVQLSAGHYVATCFLPGPDGMPHAMMGMIGEFTVADATGDVAPPQTAGEIGLTDTGIVVPNGFGTGHTYAVTNSGTKPHDFSIARLDGKPLPTYFQCVSQSFGKGTPIDECPGTLMGGLTTLRPGQTAYLTVTLPDGSYSYVSTQGDGADVQAGLVGEFRVG